MAGFEDKGHYYLDAHNNLVGKGVWELYERLMQRTSDISTLIEWDHDIPSFEILYGEAMKAKRIKTDLDKVQRESNELIATC